MCHPVCYRFDGQHAAGMYVWTLQPSFGVDTIIVLTGVDTIIVSTGMDTIIMLTGVDTIIVSTGVDTIIMSTGVDTIIVSTRMAISNWPTATVGVDCSTGSSWLHLCHSVLSDPLLLNNNNLHICNRNNGFYMTD